MDEKRKRAIRIVAFPLAFLFMLGFAETLAVLVMFIGFGKIPGNLALRKFPPQFRMTNADILTAHQVATNAGSDPTLWQSVMGFQYEPVLGFIDVSGTGWVSTHPGQKYSRFDRDRASITDKNGAVLEAFRDYAQKKFVIVTLGGSTTFGEKSWPSKLQEYTKAQGLSPEVAILNFAVPGYETFNSKVLLTSHILPALEERGITPNLILTLDGPNDFNYGFSSYLHYKKTNAANWFSNYHGWQQEHASHVEKLENDLSTSIHQVGRLFGTSPMGKGLIIALYRLMPYTAWVASRAMSYSSEKRAAAPLPRTPIDPLRTILSFKVDPSTGDETAAIPPEAERRILKKMEGNLVDLMGMSHIRKLPLYAFLQPVLLKDYYPFADARVKTEYPNANYGCRVLYKASQGRTCASFPVDWQPIVHQSERLYKQLNTTYPGHFLSLTDLFKNVKEEAFIADSMHFTDSGHQLIAEKITSVLVANKHLRRHR